MTGHIRVGGAWKEVDTIHAKVSGTWKAVDEGWTKVGGVWKQFYSAFTPFQGTGGNSTVDANGFRHHIFTSSGTFTVTAGTSAASNVYALLQHGGGNGSAGLQTGTFTVRGGNGGAGASGNVKKYDFVTIAQGDSVTVTVGAGGGSLSSVSPNTAEIFTFSSTNGGFPPEVGAYQNNPAFNPATISSGSNGISSNVFWTTTDIDGNVDLYNNVYRNQTAGGGAPGTAHAAKFETFPLTIGRNPGTLGGGAGGNASSSYSIYFASATAGSSGISNTGGGGGGGGAAIFYANNGYRNTATAGGSSGGSGYVIISYPIPT